MLDITLDVKVPAEIFNIEEFKQEIPIVLHKVAWEAQDFWKTLAGQRLKSSRLEYQNAIRAFGSSGDNSVSIGLEGGFIPLAVEEGTPGYNMYLRKNKIAPLNVNRVILFTSPEVFRTQLDNPWAHPGFPGMHIANDVQDFISDSLFPNNFEQALEKL